MPIVMTLPVNTPNLNYPIRLEAAAIMRRLISILIAYYS